MKKIFTTALAAIVGLMGILTLAACENDADIASRNLSTAADNFEIARRIVFINDITDKYLLEITGLCALGNTDTAGKLSVTCKTEDGEYLKHYLGLSDNVTFLVEQLQSAAVSAHQYRITFKPQEIIPDIDLRIEAGDLVHAPRPTDN